MEYKAEANKKIAFDVDGTLITYKDKPNYRTIQLFKWFEKQGWQMFIHSGGGLDYARHWGEKLGLEAEYKSKGDPTMEYDIAVDDALDEYNWSDQQKTNYIKSKVYIIV